MVSALALPFVSIAIAACGGSSNDAPEDTNSATTTAVTTTTTTDPCEAKRAEYRGLDLDERRVVLEAREQELRAQLMEEEAVNSPNVGTTRAQHEAVLRQLSFIEQDAARLEEEVSQLCS